MIVLMLSLVTIANVFISFLLTSNILIVIMITLTFSIAEAVLFWVCAWIKDEIEIKIKNYWRKKKHEKVF